MTSDAAVSTRRDFTIALTGDVMLGRGVDEAIGERGPAYPWGDLLPTLHAADVRLLNLECALTSVTERWTGDPNKPFFFRADPEHVEALRVARVDGVNLANNHIGDFGTAGLRETLDVLGRAGIAHVGAGVNAGEAAAPAFFSIRGWRVAVLGFADYPKAWAAGPESPGLNYTPVPASGAELQRVEIAIRSARRAADLVIFSIHWGPNMRVRPTPGFREFAHRVVAAGADVFWGHGAHVVQGVAVDGGKPILHDTGDFVDDYVVDPELRNDLSALFLLHVRPPGLARLELVPVRIARRQVNLATGRDREWLVRRVTALSAEFTTPVSERAGRLVVELGENSSTLT